MRKYARKLWHMLGIVTPLVYGTGLMTRETALFWMTLVFAIMMLGEAIRFAHKSSQEAYVHVFSLLMRDIEKIAINASVYFILGNFIAVLLFPREVACLAIVFLALGDPAAGVFGGAFGRTKLYGTKTLEGSLAFVCVCFLVAIWFVPWPVALGGALLAAVVELFVSGVFDNLTIPIAAGAGMYGMQYILKAFVK